MTSIILSLKRLLQAKFEATTPSGFEAITPGSIEATTSGQS